MDAELDERSADDATEDMIVSHWIKISAKKKHEMRQQVDEVLRPLGWKTRLIVVDRSNSISLFFSCMDLSAFTSLNDQWLCGELKRIVESLFTLLTGATVQLKRLEWPLNEYERFSKIYDQEINSVRVRERSAPACSIKDSTQHTTVPERPRSETVIVKRVNDGIPSPAS